MTENIPSVNERNLREQYREVNANQRELLKLIWQEPSVIIVIASGLVIAGYFYVSEEMCNKYLAYQLVRTFLIMFATLMSYVSLLTAIKHRFFRAVWLEKMRQIESKMKLEPTPMHTRVAIHPRGKNYWWERRSAERALIFSLFFLMIFFFLLTLMNIHTCILFWNPQTS